MIRLCPFCGASLSCPLKDGITTCDNCGRVFDSSTYNRTLSAAWVVRNWHIEDIGLLKTKFGFLDEEIAPVNEFVIEQDYSHDEFIKVLVKPN